jgi:hypothetical protein
MDAELGALSSLESALGGPAFWNPDVLSNVAKSVLHAYLLGVVAGMESGREALDFCTALKEGHPAAERIKVLNWNNELLVTLDTRVRRALAFAAGLPLEVVQCGPGAAGADWIRVGASATWLPDDLKFGTILADECQITRLPCGLHLSGRLSIERTRVSEVPEDLQVGYMLNILGTPIAALADDEIRLQAPGVTGVIIR